jgi:hypothetical protein
MIEDVEMHRDTWVREGFQTERSTRKSKEAKLGKLRGRTQQAKGGLSYLHMRAATRTRRETRLQSEVAGRC